MRLVRGGSELEKAGDEELLQGVRARERGAYEALFHRYYARVYTYVNRRLNDPSLAEETVVDVFFEIWQNASAFRGESKPSSWIFGIAHFKALSANRHRRRAKRASVIPIATEALERSPDGRDTEAMLLARDELRRLQRIVRSLGEAQREVAELVWLQGLSHEEAALELGVSVNAVKTRMSRARRRVQQALTNGEERW